MNALTTLKNAEQALVQQIDRATAAVDQIGTEAEAALDRFRQSADLARVRLADVMAGIEGILRGLTAAFAHESGEIEADLAPSPSAPSTAGQQTAREPRQDTTAPAPAPESSPVPIACQQATERGEDGDDGKIDLDWCPTYADLPEEDEVATTAANPPVERDDRPTSPSTTRRRGRGGKSGKKGGR